MTDEKKYVLNYPHLEGQAFEPYNPDEMEEVIDDLCKTDNERNHRLAVTFMSIWVSLEQSAKRNVLKNQTINGLIEAMDEIVKGDYCSECGEKIHRIASVAVMHHVDLQQDGWDKLKIQVLDRKRKPH